LAGESSEQFVVDGDDRLTTARIALTTGSTEELAVDATRLMEFGQDHMQPTSLSHGWMKKDVSTASRHVRRDGNTPRLTGSGYDSRFLAVLAGIEDEGQKA
jgi:hypothetical protein